MFRSSCMCVCLHFCMCPMLLTCVLCLSLSQAKLVRRPLDPRLEEDGLFILVRRLGVDLFIKLLGSALLERKIVLYSAHLG